MKVLCTGASGLLGSACCSVFEKAGFEFKALQRDFAWSIVNECLVDELSNIDIFVHAGANTNVEQCEIDPKSCYRDNFILTEGLANICAKVNIPFVFISSTGIYGETQNLPYREDSLVLPTTHHHRAKLLAEQAVSAANRCNLIIRTGWLFGGDFINQKNFVAMRLKEAITASKIGKSLNANIDQRGCPTYTYDLADRLLLLIREKHQGLFNVVNEGNASRFEYVRSIVDICGINVKVEPASAVTFNRNAKVSTNEMALNWRSDKLGIPVMPNWRSSLERYIHENLNFMYYD
jgi:dTDP-4-dehydrorhamnose reductase